MHVSLLLGPTAEAMEVALGVVRPKAQPQSHRRLWERSIGGNFLFVLTVAWFVCQLATLGSGCLNSRVDCGAHELAAGIEAAT